jgi:hypothetical protein
MDRKNVRELWGARIHQNDQGSSVLIVPLRDTSGVLWNYQRIYPIKLSAGDKFMCPGGRIEGCFFRFGPEPSVTSIIYVCEGYSTGASIFEAIGQGQPVVCAMTASNLLAVGLALRAKYPEARLIYCADDDRWPNSRGEVTHVGERKAREAAEATKGEVVLPRFAQEHAQSRPTDFNDVHCLTTLTQVKDQIDFPERHLPDTCQPIITKAKPTELQVAAEWLRVNGKKVIVQDNDLFLWQGTHYKHAKPREVNAIKNSLMQLAAGKWGSRDTDSAYRTLLRLASFVPEGVNLFAPNPFYANFRNGTLRLHKQKDHSYKLSFAAHSQLDYVTHVLPFDFPSEYTDNLDAKALTAHLSEHLNIEYESMLKRIWDDPDQGEKIRLWRQLTGGCLIPAFPQIVMIVGKPKTGKSTLILLAARLVDRDNRCSVDPTKFVGFNLTTMVNKLVNFDTDISTSRFLSDEVAKKIIDRAEMRIERKNKDDILGCIAGMHFFGANQRPKTLEAEGGAYDRRIIFLRTDTFQPTGLYDKEYHDFIFDSDPQGFVNAAIIGLLDLIGERGHYSLPASHAGELIKFKAQNDPVAQFIEDVKEGLLVQNGKIIWDKSARIVPETAWIGFKEWVQLVQLDHVKVTRNQFYERLRRLGIEQYPIQGVRYFHGFGEIMVQKSAC